MWSSGSPLIGAGRPEKARRMAATVSTDTHVSGVGLDEASSARVEPQLVNSSVRTTMRRATAEDNAHPGSSRCQSGEVLKSRGGGPPRRRGRPPRGPPPPAGRARAPPLVADGGRGGSPRPPRTDKQA